jgi:hypothetical protein
MQKLRPTLQWGAGHGYRSSTFGDCCIAARAVNHPLPGRTCNIIDNLLPSAATTSLAQRLQKCWSRATGLSYASSTSCEPVLPALHSVSQARPGEKCPRDVNAHEGKMSWAQREQRTLQMGAGQSSGCSSFGKCCIWACTAIYNFLGVSKYPPSHSAAITTLMPWVSRSSSRGTGQSCAFWTSGGLLAWLPFIKQRSSMHGSMLNALLMPAYTFFMKPQSAWHGRSGPHCNWTLAKASGAPHWVSAALWQDPLSPSCFQLVQLYSSLLSSAVTASWRQQVLRSWSRPTGPSCVSSTLGVVGWPHFSAFRTIYETCGMLS